MNPITSLCYLKGSLITAVDYLITDPSPTLLYACLRVCMCVYVGQAEKSVCVIGREWRKGGGVNLFLSVYKSLAAAALFQQKWILVVRWPMETSKKFPHCCLSNFCLFVFHLRLRLHVPSVE